MRHFILFTLIILFSVTGLQAQFFKQAEKLIKEATGESLSEEDAVAGIKEALTVGIKKGVEKVSVEDGYFGNPEIKIPFPEDAKMVEQKLRAIGMGSEVDKVILSLNRAAEDAATGAKEIFINAIKQMTVQDAIDIVKGEDDAATRYLEKTTYNDLFDRFKPVIKKSLDKVDATKYWNDVMTTYNKIPLVQKVNPDLDDYVTEKAIAGLFVMVAAEELKIRQDPVARTSEILRKVFGS